MSFAIKDAANLTLYDRVTNVPLFYTEDANNFEFKMSAETVYAKAKGNKKIAFDGEITAECKIEFEVIQFAHLSVMLASDVVSLNKKKVAEMQKLVLDGGKKAKLLKTKPVSGSIIAFKLGKDGQELVGEKLSISTQESGVDTEITVTSSALKEGDRIAVFYQLEAPKVKNITLSNKSKSRNFRIEADVKARTDMGEDIVLHLSIKNARAKRNAELTLSAENPSKFPMDLDCFPDESGDYAELTFIYDENAELSSLVEKLDPTIVLK